MALLYILIGLIVVLFASGIVIGKIYDKIQADKIAKKKLKKP